VSAERPVRPGKALTASAGLSVLFLVVYGGCNAFTATRHGVGSLFFPWERLIPFVPLMIVPYLSIDLFFVGAPFLCRSDRELATFAQRVIAAILVAGVCFLLFPLRFAFERPPASGWLGTIFDWFRTMDRPYNLLPSLHIALRTFLDALYARHTSGWLRIVSRMWFSLIGFSTLLTYQHHFADVIGGFALAGYCFYSFREIPKVLPVVPNRRIGFYYAAGTLISVALLVAFRPWSVLLLWPAIALGIVTAAYFGLGPGIFRKTNGLLPWSSRWALGPCLLGQRLSLLYYRWQCRAWDEVTPRVWIGRKLSRREAAAAVHAGVTAVLDLTAEFSEVEPFRRLTYLNLPILDLTAPTGLHLSEMTAFIAEQSRNGIVYVHCKIGYSRSAAAIAAYLLTTGQAATVSESLSILRSRRPSIVIRPEIVKALEEFVLYAPSSLAR
jgi:protein-tyrosine phosphatase/membrane-associated phospholipid phosphatase